MTTNRHGINHAADLEGMLDAQKRYGDSMSETEIQNQYREIQARTNTLLTVQIPERQIKYEPIPVTRIAKGIGIAGSFLLIGYVAVSAVVIGVTAVLTWCAANALAIGVVFVSGCAVVLVACSLKRDAGATGGNYSENPNGSKSRHDCGCGGDHYEWNFHNRSNNGK